MVGFGRRRLPILLTVLHKDSTTIEVHGKRRETYDITSGSICELGRFYTEHSNVPRKSHASPPMTLSACRANVGIGDSVLPGKVSGGSSLCCGVMCPTAVMARVAANTTAQAKNARNPPFRSPLGDVSSPSDLP